MSSRGRDARTSLKPMRFPHAAPEHRRLRRSLTAAPLQRINSADSPQQYGLPISGGTAALPLAAHRVKRVEGGTDTARFVAIRAAREDDVINLQNVEGSYGQVGKPLRKLWRQVWPRLLLPLGPALLPQTLQGQLPC